MRLTDSPRNPTERFSTQEVNNFMRISEILTQQDLQILISSLEDFLVSRSVVPERDLEQGTSEVLSSLSLPESLKPSGLAILSLKTYPDCWVLKKGRLSKSSLKRFQTWGIAWNGLYLYPAGGTYSGPFGALYFECVFPASSQKTDVSVFQLNMNGGGTAPTIQRYARDININGSQPYIQVSGVTTYNLPSNTLVEFTGESTSLSITLATAIETDITHEYHFIFYSGSTPTTLTLPNTVRQPDGFTVEANHVYEVSILNNNMTAQGWAVTV
mgnify:CR=1 FL=1